MNTLSRFIEPVGWALLHFLWQGAAVALLLAVFLRLARRSAPQVRYAAAGAALILMLAAAAGTVWWQIQSMENQAAAEKARTAYRADATGFLFPQAPLQSPATAPSLTDSSPAVSSAPVSAAVSPAARATPAAAEPSLAERLRPALPWLVALWAAGVVLFSLRLINAWRIVHRWRTSGSAVLPAEWLTRFGALCGRLGISRPVKLLSSAVLTVPVVIGWLKPVVLVPAGLFSGIPGAQLEAILAHELAHIRRHDYLINLLQIVVETVLFYHPAVWWVSAQLRHEREHCCDDVAASLDGDAIGYARALAALEELRAIPAAGLSAAGGSLFQRIRRLAGLPDQRAAGIAWPLGILTFSVMAVVLPFTLLHAAEPAFIPPQAAHISSGSHSAYCVHDGQETRFALLSGIAFNSSTTSGANSKLRTWHDDGKITWDRAGELTFSRTSENPATLSLTYSPDLKAAPVTAAYDLSQGRVFVVVPGGAPQQFAAATPPVTSQEALDKLYEDIAAKVQEEARRIPESVSSGTIILGGGASASESGVFGDSGRRPEDTFSDQPLKLSLPEPESSSAPNLGTMVKSALKNDSGLRLWEGVPERRLDVDLSPGIKFLTDTGGPRTPAKEELARMAFGETHTSGLRAAWVMTPPFPPQYAKSATGALETAFTAGSSVKCTVVFHNNGAKEVSFRTDSWHQDDRWIVKNAAGQEVKVKTAWYTGITPVRQIKLKPGEICEVPAHSVGIGGGLYEEGFGAGKTGAEIPAKPGDVLTCQWVVNLAGGRPDPNWTPPPDSPPATLTTGAVRFAVAAAGASSATPPGVAKSTGKCDLADGIKMQITQITEGNSSRNLATIEWYDASGVKSLEWPIELTAGLKIDPIIWRRGGTAIWIVHGLVVRKIDYTNATDVKETVIKMDEAVHPGDAPPDVMQEIVRTVHRESKERRETESGIAAPAAEVEQLDKQLNLFLPAADVKDAIVVLIDKNGAVTLSGEAVTGEQLTAKLAEIAKTRPDRAVLIQADSETPATEIFRIITVVRKAGLSRIAFKAVKSAELKPLSPVPDRDGPNTSPDERPAPRRAPAELVINVKADGSLVMSGQTITGDELKQRLAEVAKINPKYPIVIRGDVDTPYEKIVTVLDATRKAGLIHVRFASAKPAADPVPAPSPAPETKPAHDSNQPVPGAPAADDKPSGPLQPSSDLVPVPAPDGKQIYHHKDGVRTESEKDEAKREIRETTFSKDGKVITKRVFYLDKKGRTRHGVIYDGAGHPLGTLLYGYDQTTGKTVEEQQYNKDGKLIRRLYYPGALKDPKYAERFVAFTYDPNDPKNTQQLVIPPLEDEDDPAVQDPKVTAAEKLLAEGTAAAAEGQVEKARAALDRIGTVLRNRQDKDYSREYVFLLSDAYMALAKLDAAQATRIAATDKAASANFLKSAIDQVTDGLNRLLEFDHKDNTSTACRTRLGKGYLELARLLVRQDNKQDATVSYREAVKVLIELAKEEPKNQEHIVNLAVCYNEAADLLVAAKPGADGAREALEYQAFSVTALRQLMDQPSTGRRVRLLFAATLLQNSILHFDAEDKSAALKSCQEALGLTALLKEQDLPSDDRKKLEELQAKAKATAAICQDYSGLSSLTTSLRDALVLLTKQASRDAEAQKSLERFEKVLRDVLKIDDRNAPAWHALGLIAIARGQREDAKQDFLKAVDIDPACAGAHFNLAVIYSTGDPVQLDTARKHYRAAIDAGAGHDAGLDKLLGMPPADSPAQPSKDEVPKAQDTKSTSERLKNRVDKNDVKEFEKLLKESTQSIKEEIKAYQEKRRKEGKPTLEPSAQTEKKTSDAAPGISLTVMDSTGKVSLPEFRVIAGVRSQAGGNKDTINWQPHTLRVGKAGGLIWPLDRAYDEMALRVEADGYMPQVFNWIEKKKGPQDLFFQMVTDRGMNCRVVMETAEDKPAAGAVIALAMVQREAAIENGKLRQQNAAPAVNAADQWRRARIFTADADGRFTLPPENDPTAAVLFIHESGVREMDLGTFKELVSGTGEQTGYRCKLRPWARVTGKVLWGGKPAGAGQKVSLTIHRDSYGYPGIIAQYESTTTAADGSFVFEKVLPGQVQLSCPIATGAGNQTGPIREVNLNGRITHVTLNPGDNPVVIGGGGRTIKGKLTGRDKWDGITFHFHPTAPHVGFPGDDEMWKAFGEFQKSPEGALYFRNGLKVQPDGTFEVTGVMPGDYQIFFKREGEDKYMASGKFSLGAEAAVKDTKAAEDIGEFKAGP